MDEIIYSFGGKGVEAEAGGGDVAIGISDADASVVVDVRGQSRVGHGAIVRQAAESEAGRAVGVAGAVEEQFDAGTGDRLIVAHGERDRGGGGIDEIRPVLRQDIRDTGAD